MSQILKLENGKYWTAQLSSGGLEEYEGFDDIGKSNKKSLIKDISATAILKDKAGGIWVTSLEKGVFYLSNTRIEAFSQQNAKLPSDWVSSISSDEKGNIYMGFWKNEVGCFDTFKKYQTIDKISGNVYDIQWHPKKKALFYGGGGFLKEWNGTSKHLIKGNRQKNFSISSKKFSTNFTSDSIFYITAGGNSISYIKGSISYEKFKYAKLAGIATRSFSIYEDKKGNVWTGKLDGLYVIQGEQLIKIDTVHPALTCRVEDINELPNGALVIGTKGNGLVIWDKKKVTHLTSKQGLLSDIIEEIAIDKQGDIWLATLSGVNHLYKNNNNDNWQIEPITVFNGLPTNEINSIAFSAEGTWVATTKGLALIHPQKNSALNPKPALISFKVNGVFKNTSEPLCFSHQENNIEIEWNVFNYTMNGKIPYRYRFGNKADWQYAMQHNIQLPSMASGNYLLEVQAQNENSIWSESLYVRFDIAAAWYTTWYFRTFILLLAASGFYYWNQLRLQKVKDNVAIQLKINELERTALASQMNPHFVFNGLNSIQRLIQNDQKKDAMNYLGHFAKLVRTTLESTRLGKITLENEIKLLEHYLSLEQLRFKDGFQYTLSVEEQIDTFDVEIPPMLIQPFVENAIKYAWGVDNKNAIINIDFHKKENTLLINIKDNGVGFHNKYIDKSDSTGLGITLTKERLALHNERKTQRDIDIYSDESGTKVSLWVSI